MASTYMNKLLHVSSSSSRCTVPSPSRSNQSRFIQLSVGNTIATELMPKSTFTESFQPKPLHSALSWKHDCNRADAKKELMAIRTVQIRDIGPRENNIRIKVRVCRLWQAKRFKPVEKNDGLQFILVDEMNDAIHGFIRQGSCELLASSIIQGNTYEISHFFTSYSQSSFKIVPHPAQIHFTAKTIIRHVPELSASIPLHRFYFIDYDHLATRLNNKILSDVLGRMKMIQPTEDIQTSDNRIESRCDIYLQNIRKEDVQVTLWGDIARTIDVDAIKAAGAPALAVFTSLKVNKYQNKIITLSSTRGTSFFLNPDIEEDQPYK